MYLLTIANALLGAVFSVITSYFTQTIFKNM